MNTLAIRIFDDGKGFSPLTNLESFTDVTVVHRNNQWMMYGAGSEKKTSDLNILCATLPPGQPLATEGWDITIDPDDTQSALPIASKSQSYLWDGKGGRHCPSYVRGFDSNKNAWVERIYYAGAAEHPWGPYAIGFLEWNGTAWIDQSAPAFTAMDEWERGSVFEPNLIYHDGKWKLWYVAGSHQENYLIQGYAESPDGNTNWTNRQMFCTAEENIFDFVVTARKTGFEAIFARPGNSAASGLWRCYAETPGDTLTKWSKPVQITASGWKPSPVYTERGTLLIFHDNAYPKPEGGSFPFHLTTDVLEVSE